MRNCCQSLKIADVCQATIVFIILCQLIAIGDCQYPGGSQSMFANRNGQDRQQEIDKLLSPSKKPYPYRVKRQLPSPLSIRDCSSQPNCRDIGNVTSTSNTLGDGQVYYAATRSRILKILVSSDTNALCACSVIYNSSDPVLSIAVDDHYIYWFNEQRKMVNYLPVEAGNELPQTPQVLKLSQEILASDKKHLHAACRMPSYVPSVPKPTVTSGSYLLFNLTEISKAQDDWHNSATCVHEMRPNVSFAFVYLKRNAPSSADGIPSVCHRSDSECMYETFDQTAPLDKIKLDNLSPNTDYLVHLIVYSEAQNHKSAVISPGSVMRTSCGLSSPVSNLKCQAKNEVEFGVCWMPPEQQNSVKIRYEVYINGTIPYNDFDVSAIGESNLTYRSSSEISHSFTVRVFPVDCPQFADQYSTAEVKNCKPFLPAAKPIVEKVTDTRATLKWDAPPDNSVRVVYIQWTLLEDFPQGRNTHSIWSWSEPMIGNKSFTYHVTDLVPYSPYSFRAYQQYVGHSADSGWRLSPEENTVTRPGVPGFPENVRVEKMSSDEYLMWTKPNSNGESLEYFVIAYRNRSSPNASRVLYGSWVTAANVSAKFARWQLTDLMPDVWYEFMVSAVNAVGHGDGSAPSAPFFYFIPQDDTEDHTLWIVVGTAGSLVVLLFIAILIVACKHCGQKPATYQSPPSSEITTIHLSYGTDLELAQIRHMTEIANFRGVPNIPQDYMDLLPLFPREKLTLTDFLGKGAFGEVYKGIAEGVDDESGIETKVAVKTLREGSTDSEKCEFLMEAYFMNNFNHKNILSLLGVCLDNEPQYLILELMEGGDLLRYVREARPNPIMGPKLTTSDLLDICLDVAAGCKYLEEQRFIHRDLAARNCLVSTKAYRTESRVVKIGDFGLARDIYRNDYYHKAGEGLLPVRWMAPESLVDNLYTTQSDSWSFGVLLWEIMTFGQQPYPARTNLEVLQLVRAGGRLDKPENCPNDIYALMLKCWNSTPSLRPSFSWALDWLQEFKRRNQSVLFEDDYSIGVPNVHYTTVTTSEEDMVDDSNPQDTVPKTPRSPEHRFTAAVLGFENAAFEPQEGTGGSNHFIRDMVLDSDDDRDAAGGGYQRNFFPSRMHLRDPPAADNGNSYLRISRDFNRWPNRQLLDESTSGAQTVSGAEASENSGISVEDALNYSILGFPPSRNPSTRSNIPMTPKESQTPHFTLPLVEEAMADILLKDDFLLPYMGDLPITDEERLMRKQHWTQQNKLMHPEQTLCTVEDPNEGLGVSSSDQDNNHVDYEQVSPYMRGSLLNHNNNGNSDSEPSTSRSYLDYMHTAFTHPKQTYNMQGNMVPSDESFEINTVGSSDEDSGACRTIHITMKGENDRNRSLGAPCPVNDSQNEEGLGGTASSSLHSPVSGNMSTTSPPLGVRAEGHTLTSPAQRNTHSNAGDDESAKVILNLPTYV